MFSNLKPVICGDVPDFPPSSSAASPRFKFPVVRIYSASFVPDVIVAEMVVVLVV